MAITDIQISEELETNAPSIKYRGNEGPKSPQEEQMMMADAILEEEYNKYVFDLLEIRPEATPMTLEEFRQMVIAEGQMSGGQPLPQDPTKPVNPFQPKPTGPTLPDRQMAAYGGIMGVDGRRQYGIGSSLKKFVRKVIPNEVSEVAVKAAPFVAPFNPQLAAAMAGIGGFDQTGRIGSSLKSAAMTYGLGQLGRQIGGAGFQDPSMSLQGFTNLSSPTTGASIFGGFGGPKAAPSEFLRPNIGDVSGQKSITPTNLNDYVGTTKPDLGGIYSADNVTQKGIADLAKYPVTDPASVNKASGLSRFLTKAKEYVPTSFGDLKDPKKLLGAIGISSALAAASGMGTAEETVSEIMDRGDGLDLDSIRLEVREAFKDPSGQKLAALRNKYPYLGTQASKDIANMAMGGRIGFEKAGPVVDEQTTQMILDMKKRGMDVDTISTFTQQNADTVNAILSAQNKKAEGGIMDLGGMEKDYRNTGGFVDIGEYEKKDDVPARLSVNEFVMTADAVRGMGDGDIDLGAKRMENLMGAMENKKGAQQMFDVSERLSEVV
jgi:hypothetical protein